MEGWDDVDLESLSSCFYFNSQAKLDSGQDWADRDKLAREGLCK